jgi:3-deoxy-D-manno-octulosonic-acid transferase
MPRLFPFDLRKSLGRTDTPAARNGSVPHIWVQADATMADGAGLITEALLRQRPDLSLVLALPEMATSPAGPVPGITRRIVPADMPAAATRLLQAENPDLIVFLGADLPHALPEAAQAAGCPMLWVGAAGLAQRPGLLGRRDRRRRLERLARIFPRDDAAFEQLQTEGAPPNRLEPGGMLSPPFDPLPCSEAERSSFAARIRTRPVWLATTTPEAELETVLAAHRHVLRHAHRTLLLLAPDDDRLGPDWAERLEAAGWRVARRSAEGEPDEDVQIFIADDAQEYGLWYRLAPMSYMGGTLLGGALLPRMPFEPAALGSAVLHGPRHAPFEAPYRQLVDARASRVLRNPGQLGEALADLIAPDRTALLAQAAWAVTSGGAGQAERIAAAALEELAATRQEG